MTCKACDEKQKGMAGSPFMRALRGSPVLAYAWELGLPFVPFHLNIRNSWSASSPATSQVV